MGVTAHARALTTVASVERYREDETQLHLNFSGKFHLVINLRGKVHGIAYTSAHLLLVCMCVHVVVVFIWHQTDCMLG